MRIKELKEVYENNMLPNLDVAYGPLCNPIITTKGEVHLRNELACFFQNNRIPFNLDHFNSEKKGFAFMNMEELLSSVPETTKIPFAHCVFVPVTFLSEEGSVPFYKFLDEDADISNYHWFLF